MHIFWCTSFAACFCSATPQLSRSEIQGRLFLLFFSQPIFGYTHLIQVCFDLNPGVPSTHVRFDLKKRPHDKDYWRKFDDIIKDWEKKRTSWVEKSIRIYGMNGHASGTFAGSHRWRKKRFKHVGIVGEYHKWTRTTYFKNVNKWREWLCSEWVQFPSHKLKQWHTKLPSQQPRIFEWWWKWPKQSFATHTPSKTIELGGFRRKQG